MTAVHSDPIHSLSTGEPADVPTPAERDFYRILTMERFGQPVREWRRADVTARQEREAAALRLIVDNTDPALIVGYAARNRRDNRHRRWHRLVPLPGGRWTAYCGNATECTPDDQATGDAVDCPRCLRSVQGERGAS